MGTGRAVDPLWGRDPETLMSSVGLADEPIKLLAHLMRRVGVGATRDELEQLVERPPRGRRRGVAAARSADEPADDQADSESQATEDQQRNES